MVEASGGLGGESEVLPGAAVDGGNQAKELEAYIKGLEGEYKALKKQLTAREARIEVLGRAHRERWLTACAGALGAVLVALLIIAVAWGGKSYAWPDVALLGSGILSIAGVVWAVRGRARNDD